MNLHVQISWQAQRFVNPHVQISWQAQHFVNLEVQISWQAQHFVNLHVQISWQAQDFVNLHVQISWQAQHFVQVHLPKENLQHIEYCPVDKLRPIVIETALWRALASTWVRREETQKWAQGWAPIEAFGGIAGKSIEDVLARFHIEFMQPSTAAVVSLDLAKCFDHVSVPLALKCLQKLGMPEPMIFACQHVWGQQIRYLQYRGGCISATPSHVSNSLPQGDALSVIALLAILSMPTLDLRRQAAQDGEHVNMITFVDDRSFLTQNAVYAMTMINPWMQWSVDLGLVENDRKICVVARTTSVKATMLAYGAEQKWFVPTARILRQPGDVFFLSTCSSGLLCKLP